MEWVDRNGAIRAIAEKYPRLGINVNIWNNHWLREKTQALVGDNTIVSMTRSQAARVGVDFDAIAEDKKTKYIFRLDTVLEYFGTHGRRK